MLRPLSLLALLLATVAVLVSAVGDKYLIGVGKGDITGPVVEIPFHGYAMLDQKGTGVKQRLYSRSFIIADVAKPSDRILYIIADIQGGDTGIRNSVLDGLKAMGADYLQYTKGSLAFVGTHSYSGPGGWHNYLLHQFPSAGFDKQRFDAIVAGTLLSIKRAHESMVEGYLDVGTAEVVDGNINRSLWAYLANPEPERTQYGTSTDTQMTLLRFKRASDGKNIGLLNWYAVHGTSVHNNNTLVNGDNKGVAAYLTEQAFGEGFVAGFSQANVGDTSPNVLGQYCEDGSKAECTLAGSSCADGTIQNCHGRGPMFTEKDNGLSSCYEMGRRQYAAAQSIMDNMEAFGTPVIGSTVKSFHFFKDMQYFTFPFEGSMVQTCPGALGFSFGAGTTDGPGLSDFMQGSTAGANSVNPFWKIVSGVIRTPSQQQKACQGVKPILLDVGEMALPYAWTPNIVDIQLMRVGQLVMIVAATEATTMAGRRWRNTVSDAARTILPPDVEPIVVLGGPANTYTHYATTPEEYDIQRYEGASTLYGRYTLPAYINLTTSAIGYLSPTASTAPPPGPPPPDHRTSSLSFIPGVVYDNVPLGKTFGQVLDQPSASYARGAVVSVRFQAANPRNNLRLEETYAAVEQLLAGKWVRVRDDSDWFLEYTWARANAMLPATSEVTIKWATSTQDGAGPGTYRVLYYGDSKAALTGKISAFVGTSNQFTLV